MYSGVNDCDLVSGRRPDRAGAPYDALARTEGLVPSA
jgi:hypothetical protein